MPVPEAEPLLLNRVVLLRAEWKSGCLPNRRHCHYVIATMSLPSCHCHRVIATMALPPMCVLEGLGLACIKHHVPNILSIELGLDKHVATACVPGWDSGRKLRVKLSILGCQRRLWHDEI